MAAAAVKKCTNSLSLLMEAFGIEVEQELSTMTTRPGSSVVCAAFVRRSHAVVENVTAVRAPHLRILIRVSFAERVNNDRLAFCFPSDVLVPVLLARSNVSINEGASQICMEKWQFLMGSRLGAESHLLERVCEVRRSPGFRALLNSLRCCLTVLSADIFLPSDSRLQSAWIDEDARL